MNQLKVNRQQSIIGLYQQGWSKRRIARELQLDRATVRKYLAAEISKSPTPQTGSEPDGSSKSPTVQTGSASVGGAPSSCEPWREQIERGLLAGLSVQRIYQDLVSDHQFAGSYHAVRRFVLRQQTVVEVPYRRME